MRARDPFVQDMCVCRGLTFCPTRIFKGQVDAELLTDDDFYRDSLMITPRAYLSVHKPPESAESEGSGMSL